MSDLITSAQRPIRTTFQIVFNKVHDNVYFVHVADINFKRKNRQDLHLYSKQKPESRTFRQQFLAH